MSRILLTETKKLKGLVVANLCAHGLAHQVDSHGGPLCSGCAFALQVLLDHQMILGVEALVAISPAKPGEHGPLVLVGSVNDLQRLSPARRGCREFVVRELLPAKGVVYP